MQPQGKPASVKPAFKRKPSAQVQCDMRLICPQRWGKLQKTNDANVRHCQVCARDVHYCRDEAELAAAIAASCCVAFTAKSPQKPKRIKMLGDPIGLTYSLPAPSESMLGRLWRKVRAVIGVN